MMQWQVSDPAYTIFQRAALVVSQQCTQRVNIAAMPLPTIFLAMLTLNSDD